MFGKKCIYTPSCSVYSMEAYRHYGFFRATMLTAARIFRCAPWGKGGFDPVPYNKKGDGKWFL
jgi:putative membrane protein insertion efficiency factor